MKQGQTANKSATKRKKNAKGQQPIVETAFLFKKNINSGY